MSVFTKIEAKAFQPSLYITASVEEEGTGKFCQFYCSFRMLCCCNSGAFPHRNFTSSGEICGALLRNWELALCWNTQDLQWGIHVGGEGGCKRGFSRPSESRSLSDCTGYNLILNLISCRLKRFTTTILPSLTWRSSYWTLKAGRAGCYWTSLLTPRELPVSH